MKRAIFVLLFSLLALPGAAHATVCREASQTIDIWATFTNSSGVRENPTSPDCFILDPNDTTAKTCPTLGLVGAYTGVYRGTTTYTIPGSPDTGMWLIGVEGTMSGSRVFAPTEFEVASSCGGAAGDYVTTTGTADSGTTTTLVDAALTEADTDYWAGSCIRFTSGTITGQVRVITAFSPATDTVTFTPAVTQAVTTNTYDILPCANVVLAAVTHTGATVPTVTTLTGHTPQTGDSYARLGAPAGASVSADVAAVKTDTAAVLDDTGTSGVIVVTNNDKTGYNISGTKTTLDALNDVAATDIVSAGAITTLSGAVVNVDTVDTTTTNTDMRGTDSALLAASAPTNFGDLAITATTGRVTVGTNNDKTGYSISGTKTTLDALNDVSTADVNAQADQALSDVNLDHLVGTATGIPSMPAGTFLDQIMDDGTAVFDRTTDSLQAIADSGGGGPTVAQIADGVWDEAISGHLTAGSTGEKLNSAASAGDPWSTSIPGAYGAGTAGKIVGDSLTGHTPQTGDSYARLGAPAGASVSADVAAVKTDTAAVLDDTGTSGVIVVTNNDKTGYSLTAGERTSIATEIIGTALDGSRTLQCVLAAAGAVLDGKSVASGGVVTFYAPDDVTARVAATYSSGSRSVTVTCP